MEETSPEQMQQALNAQQIFMSGKYKESLNSLKNLTTSRPKDPKVLHNVAVAEFFLSSQRSVDEFCSTLDQVCQKANITLNNVNCLDDTDHCFIYYNYAVILYHQEQYYKALPILEKLYGHIASLEDLFAFKILHLLADLYIHVYKPNDALKVLEQADNYVRGDKPIASSPDEEIELKSKVFTAKVRALLMLRSFKKCRKEVKNFEAVAGSKDTAVTYLKANLQYERMRHLKARKLLNQAPGAQSITMGQSVPVMFHNNYGCSYLQTGQHHLGLNSFSKAFQELEHAVGDLKKTEPGKKPLQLLAMSRHHELFYNLGVQMLFAEQPLGAFDCFMEIITVFPTNPCLWLRLAECCVAHHRKSNDVDRSAEVRQAVIQKKIGEGPHRKLILNRGVNQPHSQGTEIPTTPVVTLEFASLCLRNALELLPKNLSASSNSSEKQDDNTSVKLTAESSDLPPQAGEAGGGDQFAGDSDSGDEALEVEQSRENKTLYPCPPGSPMAKQDVENLKSSILTSSAYVALCLDNPLVAMQYASDLLKQPGLSPAQRYLGQMYLAEAYVSLDKITEAIDLLNPESIEDISTTLPSSTAATIDRLQRQQQQRSQSSSVAEATLKSLPQQTLPLLQRWVPRNTNEAQGYMMYNLAATRAIRGEFEKALGSLKEASKKLGAPSPAQSEFLHIYLQLMMGHREEALEFVKKRFGYV